MNNITLKEIRHLVMVTLFIFSEVLLASQPENGVYYVISKSSNKALTIETDSNNNVEFKQHPISASDISQKWILKKSDDGFVISSLKHNKSIATHDEQLLLSEQGTRWTLTPWQDAFLIEDLASERAIHLLENKQENGAPIGVYSPETTENSQWFLVLADDVASALSHTNRPATNAYYDTNNKIYSFYPYPSAAEEADRLKNNKFVDYHPSGLYVRKGETIKIALEGVDALSIVVGPPYISFSGGATDNSVYVTAQKSGSGFSSPADGMMYFRHITHSFTKAARATVKVLAGGKPVPLYIAGQTSLSEWRQMLATYKNAPFVEMVNDKAMITVTRTHYDSSVQADPAEIFAITDKIIDAYNELSGLANNNDTINRPSPLRVHYLDDYFSKPAEVANAYMYATDYMIGMPDSSSLDLLNPKTLKFAWSIWHETGHLFQQIGWTTDYLVEVTVNIYSLYIQSLMGLPSRLDDAEDSGKGKSYRALAQEYLQTGGRDFSNVQTFPDSDVAVWVRLVMYDRMGAVLGKRFYPELHTYYRNHPLNDDSATDQQKINTFAYRASLVSGFNLTDFFILWGIHLSNDTIRKIASLKLPEPPAEIMAVRGE
ncbi:M60 family metallopeptidase [Aeromonas piscicola]|uniref:M60 family metallopeptidase n=1 Tax=Aeromonas piscicola TaxID=600645 RepID=UPI0021F824C2|nr:M60 family metallopeptidase [Aeromonas piscicola]MCW0506066.1 M60 family metallopeptidase [Aeromonas piscicola]